MITFTLSLVALVLGYYAVRLPYMLDLLVQGRLPEDALQQLPKVIV